MTLTIGVLSWGAHYTLRNTLESYRFWGLDKLADQKIIWFQEISEEDIMIAQMYGWDYDGSSTNIGIAGGYKELVARATGSLFLFLENDWRLIQNPEIQIITGAVLLEAGATDVVRYRSRKYPGNPLWTLQFKGNELSRPEHLLDCLHWEEHPEKFPQIHKLPYGWYRTDARYANWTNNPTMFRTDLLKSIVLTSLWNGDGEKSIQGFWQEQSQIKVMQGDGLFEHYRIG